MRGLRWLEARYRTVLARLGYEYPPYYMLITESAMVALTIGAAVPRFLAGPQGQQWIWLIAAVVLSAAHMEAALIRAGTVSITAHTAVTIATSALFWTVYTPYDVVPLIVVLGMTQVAAVSRSRTTALHLIAYEALILGAGLTGAIHQAWLIGFTVAFGAAVGRLLQNQLLLLRAERDAQAARISLDRATIAGEVHDVVAHSLAVVPLIVVLGMTQVAAVSRSRTTALHLIAYEALILGAGLTGAIHQAWLIGFTVAFGAAVGRLLQNQLLLLRAERDAQAARISLDRATIAGEVHDVVAHSLAVVLLNVTAARRSLEADDDRDEAVDALRDAETQGRTAMNDIRRTIELLRTEGSDAAQPGIADIPELVASYERAGLPVELDLLAPADPLPASSGLAAFRVVQESLANAVKHAPGARVDVAVAPEPGRGVSIRVSCPVPDGARRSPGGSGLAGMRARVESAGGTLEAGPVHGIWLVAATFPTAEENR